MKIAVPREIKDSELRVAMTPAGVRELVSHGHRVLVEAGAGRGSAITDAEFASQGATILESADELWGEADLVCKVKEPVEVELGRLRRDLVLFTYLHLAASATLTEAVVASKVTAIAYETVQLPDRSLPLLAPMSEVAGRMAPLVGAAHLMAPAGGRGVLLTGLAGVAAARVVIIGAGVAGANAAAIAVGNHAHVEVLDRDLDRLRVLDHHYSGRLTTLAASEHAIERACCQADLVIGAVLVPGAKAPRLVSDALVAEMREGSVLVDISVDQGGCFESSRPTTHREPTFAVHGSLFYCVANMPGAVPHTSTYALANATLPYLLEIAEHGWRQGARQDHALALGLNAVDGALTNAAVAEAHGRAHREVVTLLS